MIALVLVTLASFAPLLTLAPSLLTANMMHCPLDEGSVHPCIIAGEDFGEALYTGQVLGWLMLITWPGMLLTTAVWIILGSRKWLRRVRTPA